MLTYIEYKDKNGVVLCVNRSDGWSIPADSANTDYQAYLKWISEGNTPEPAEETI